MAIRSLATISMANMNTMQYGTVRYGIVRYSVSIFRYSNNSNNKDWMALGWLLDGSWMGLDEGYTRETRDDGQSKRYVATI